MILINAVLGLFTIDKSLIYNTKLPYFGKNSIPISQLEPFVSLILSSIVYALHGFCLLICILAMIFNNAECCAKRIPPLLITTLLVMNTLFNIAGVIVIGICSKSMDKATLEPKYSIILRSTTVFHNVEENYFNGRQYQR